MMVFVLYITVFVRELKIKVLLSLLVLLNGSTFIFQNDKPAEIPETVKGKKKSSKSKRSQSTKTSKSAKNISQTAQVENNPPGKNL